MNKHSKKIVLVAMGLAVGMIAALVFYSGQDTDTKTQAVPTTQVERVDTHISDGVRTTPTAQAVPLDPDCDEIRPTRPYNWLMWDCYNAGLLDPVAAQMFDTDAGFAHAQDGSGVIKVASNSDVDVAAVVAGWNDLAERDFLVVDDNDPHVTWQEHSSATWVSVTGSDGYTGPYDSCTVNYASTDTGLMQHEIGHCLGFADHLTSDIDPSNYINPANCDDPEAANYSEYIGVMSYCDLSRPDRWWAPDDKASLVEAGYVNSM